MLKIGVDSFSEVWYTNGRRKNSTRGEPFSHLTVWVSYNRGSVFGWEFGLTTFLTIYGFGLRGNSAYKSIGKHRFRTKKHHKVNKSSQKTMAYLFGTMRPGVRTSALRPKSKKAPLGAFLFYRSVGWENSAFRLRKWSAPSEQSREVLAHLRLRIVTSNVVRDASLHLDHLWLSWTHGIVMST